MFQRFHEVKSLQESELVQTGDESRSSTPGNALDSRVMYISHSSPLTPQHTTLVSNSYPSISSPVMTSVPTVFSSSKYLSSPPPEAHRYAIDSYRTTTESDEHIRYIVDSNRISVDPYSRHLSVEEHQRIPSEVQHRLRIEEQPLEPYHRSVDELYRSSNPVDLQRITDSNSQQLINAQRLVSQLQRIQSDGIRSATSSADHLQRHDANVCVSSPNAPSLNYRNSINDSLRPSSELQRVVQESLLRTHADPQRLVQESFREYFAVSPRPRHSIDNEIINPAPDLRISENIRYSDSNRETLRYSNSPRITMVSENMRINSNPHHMIQENVRPSSTPHDIISENMRLDAEQNHSISDNLRLGSITPHNVMPENLRLGNIIPQNMMTENLRVDSETSHNLIPENLIVRSNLHSILTNNLRTDTSHTLISDNQRMRIDSSHALISDNVRMRSELSHHMPEDINGDVSLNMMHENLRMGAGTPHTIMSENRRVGLGPELSHSLLIENLRVGAHTPQELMHENMRRGAETPLNMMPDNLRVGAETPHNMMRETIRIGAETPHNMISENLIRVGAETPHNMMRETLRMGTETSHNSIMHESMRMEPETPHMMHENLRITPEASRMVPENLCLTDPTRQVIPENLHISPSVNGIGRISNGRTLTHVQPPNSPMSQMRSHYDSSPHRIMAEVPHTIRDHSPHYDDSPYRSEIQNINASVPTTPAPYLPSVPDPSSTPVSQYYSSSYTPHTSHSVHNNDYAAYIDDGCDEGNMSLEEKINRGYHDIKPFDQNYPVNVPLMHMSQDSLPPPPSIPKLPKPKKPKEPKPPRLPVIHKCTECSRIFKNSTQLKNHMWRHTGEKPFACDQCGSKFTQQGNLRAHRRIHTGERPYQCPDCKACFTQLSTLKTHQKIHSDERPYKCNECDAAFRQVANLKTHLVTHTGERPHQCDMCEKAFTQKSNLKAHKNRVHTGEGITIPAKRGRKKNPLAIKPFNCLECGAKFTMVSNLKIHAKLHSGDKPFECDYCGAGFAQRSNLKTHIQRMHGGGPASKRRRIRCDECPAMFRLKRCLKTHKKRRHPIKSLKIKILRESKYMMNSVPVEDEEDSEEEEEEDGDGEEEDEFEYDEEEESDGETKISPLLTKKPKIRMSKNNSQLTSQEEESGNDVSSSHEKMETSITEPIICLREPKSEPFESPVSPPLSDDCRITEDYSTGRTSLLIQPQGKENEPFDKDGPLPFLVESQRYEGSLNIKEEEQQAHGNEAESNHMPLLSSKAIAS